jgi:hypothetical protein
MMGTANATLTGLLFVASRSTSVRSSSIPA